MLSTLLERDAGEALPLPSALADRYGGPLRVPSRDPWVFANFVSTLDGVVSYDVPGADKAAQVSEGHPDDRFVLALLRAVADAVVVGAGTLRKEPSTLWTPEFVLPEAAADFAALRRAMGLRPVPLTVIVTASGRLDLSLPVFRAPGPLIVATTADGASRLVGSPVRTVAVAEGTPLPSRAIIDLAVREGGSRVLTEGGPNLLGRFLDDGVVDELFLTIAPRLAGRSDPQRRLALVEGTAFTPAGAPRARIVSLKASGDYLFTRYALG